MGTFFFYSILLQFNNCSESLFLSKIQRDFRGSDIQQRHTGRVINRDVCIGCSAFTSAEDQFADLTDVCFTHNALLDRNLHFPCFDAVFHIVHKDFGICEDLRIQFLLAFADAKDFLILSFGKNVWFENIIFDIMYAVQFDDKVYLSEEKIDAMLSGRMNRSELDIILKGISLKLRQFISVVYISGDFLDAGRLLRSFYLLKGFQSKGLMVRYEDGVFLITTSSLEDHKSHDLIRREAFELLDITENTDWGMSDVHERTALDRAFRESWQCCIASAVEHRSFPQFSATGIYRVLLPSLDNEEAAAFAGDVLHAIADKADLLETALVIVRARRKLAL